MSDIKTSWSLIAHGGAKDISTADEQSNREGLFEAIEIGTRILSKGGTALTAVEEVVKSLENNPAYNAGYGSVRNRDGYVEMDASIMDGRTLDIGAVACIKEVDNPVSVARALLKEREIFLVGDGATKFAFEMGFINSPKIKVKTIKNIGCDTVGCVARDVYGDLAVATSTGGLEGTRAGRVGDVPLPGCGFYADNKRGAVSVSGDGESIARVMLVAEFLHLAKNMSSDEASAKVLKLLDRVKGEAGIISIDPKGKISWAHNSSHFAVGIAKQDSNTLVFLKKGDEK
jgi:beta-aspartyl-peptidase (threonine type)